MFCAGTSWGWLAPKGLQLPTLEMPGPVAPPADGALGQVQAGELGQTPHVLRPQRADCHRCV